MGDPPPPQKVFLFSTAAVRFPAGMAAEFQEFTVGEDMWAHGARFAVPTVVTAVALKPIKNLFKLAGLLQHQDRGQCWFEAIGPKEDMSKLPATLKPGTFHLFAKLCLKPSVYDSGGPKSRLATDARLQAAGKGGVRCPGTIEGKAKKQRV